jgi:hypothetical protein
MSKVVWQQKNSKNCWATCGGRRNKAVNAITLSLINSRIAKLVWRLVLIMADLLSFCCSKCGLWGMLLVLGHAILDRWPTGSGSMIKDKMCQRLFVLVWHRQEVLKERGVLLSWAGSCELRVVSKSGQGRNSHSTGLLIVEVLVFMGVSPQSFVRQTSQIEIVYALPLVTTVLSSCYGELARYIWVHNSPKWHIHHATQAVDALLVESETLLGSTSYSVQYSHLQPFTNSIVTEPVPLALN